MVEHVDERVQLALLVQRCAISAHRGRHARLAEVGGEPVVLAGVPSRQRAQPASASSARTATCDRAEDRGSEGLDLPKRVLNTLARSGVLEMAGVADQHPPRPRRLAEEPLPAEHPEQLADPLCPRQCLSHRVARRTYSR